MIIDFHTHIFPPEMKDRQQDYLKDDALFNELFSSPKARIATADELVSSMDEAGVDLSVVLNAGWTNHKDCARTNDYILEAAARHPKRLVPFCAIQPRAGKAALAELERCVRGGARGIGEMRSDTQGFDMADREVMGLIAEVAKRHNLIFLTHASEPAGHQYPGKGTITPGPLYHFIRTFPDLTVVCAHWGGGLPFYALMPEVAAVLANTFFDTAATPFLYKPEIFKHVVHIVGPDKILFGSDNPLMSPRRVTSQIESADLSEEAKAMILGGNAQRLLGWS